MLKQYIIPSIAVIIALLFSISTLYFFIESGKLKNQNIALTENLTTILTSLAQTNQSLVETTYALNTKAQQLGAALNELLDTKSELNYTKEKLKEKEAVLANTASDLQVLEARYEELNETFGTLKEEVLGLEESINSYISWFKTNSNFSDSLLDSAGVYPFIKEIKKKCVDADAINLACLPFVMEKKLDFGYIFEKEDRLYSLEEIVKNKGGDCEDYSIFTKALLNYIKGIYPSSELTLRSWKTSFGSHFTIYTEGTSYWYVDNAEEYTIGDLGDLNPSVFCHTVTCADDACEGHCIVGVSETKIENVTDLGNLEGTKLFEPQNGQYLGKIGSTYTICEKSIEDCGKKSNHIFVIIGDDDLYVFEEGNWSSYKYYLQTVGELKKELGNN